MAMHDIDPFPQHNVSKNREEGEHSREGGASVDDEEWDVVDFESVGEISNTGAPFVGVRDDDYFVAPVDQFRRELVDVRFDAAGLGKEEVADHGDAVGGRHDGCGGGHMGPCG